MRTTSEMLHAAADTIQVRGWTQAGSEHDDPWGGGAGSTAPVCLEGAILAVMGISVSEELHGPNLDETNALLACPVYRAVADYLGPRYDPQDGARLFHFNDTPSTTKERVIEVLRAAAAVEASKEDAAERAAIPAQRVGA